MDAELEMWNPALHIDAAARRRCGSTSPVPGSRNWPTAIPGSCGTSARP
ncbi:hypothetical protein ACU686_25870 [Yinghuangia aomiensis]